MVKKRIIPIILLKEGRCVKGVNFKNFRDVGNPTTVARVYDAQKADELVFLDIMANHEDRSTLFEVVRKTADECFMPLCVGGGVKSISDIRVLLKNGADKVSINTAAVENPTLVEEAVKIFGSSTILVSIDVKKTEKFGHEVFTHSGTVATGLNALDWAKQVERLGAGEILITSIDQEGTRNGYDLDLVKVIVNNVGIPVIASGGVGNLKDLEDGINIGGASGVSLGSILHFTDQNVIKARNYFKTVGINVRM